MSVERYQLSFFVHLNRNIFRVYKAYHFFNYGGQNTLLVVCGMNFCLYSYLVHRQNKVLPLAAAGSRLGVLLVVRIEATLVMMFATGFKTGAILLYKATNIAVY